MDWMALSSNKYLYHIDIIDKIKKVSK